MHAFSRGTYGGSQHWHGDCINGSVMLKHTLHRRRPGAGIVVGVSSFEGGILDDDSSISILTTSNNEPRLYGNCHKLTLQESILAYKSWRWIG